MDIFWSTFYWIIYFKIIYNRMLHNPLKFFFRTKEGKLSDKFLWLIFLINMNGFFTNGHYRNESFWHCWHRTATSAGSYNDNIHNVIIQGGLGGEAPQTNFGVLKGINRKFSFKGENLRNEFSFRNFPQWGRVLMRSFSFSIQLKII